MVKEVNNFITQNFYVRVACDQQHVNNANRILETEVFIKSSSQ